MKKLTLLSLAILLVPAWAGPIIVTNGGGIAEYNITYAQKAIGAWTTLCASQDECGTGIEHGLAALARAGVPAIATHYLTSEVLGEAVYRRASSGGLEINTDKLFAADSDGEPVPWDLAAAVDFWIEVADANSPVPNAETVKSRMRRLAASLYTRTQNPDADLRYIGAVLFTDPVSALVLDQNTPGTEPQAIEVPFASLDCDAATGIKQRFTSMQILSARWMSNQKAVDPAHPRITLTGKIRYACSGAGGIAERFEADYIVRATLERTTAGIRFLDDSLTVRQERIRTRP